MSKPRLPKLASQAKAEAAIRQKHGGLRGLKDVMPCPACGQPMNYTIAPFTSVITAQCATPGCVQF